MNTHVLVDIYEKINQCSKFIIYIILHQCSMFVKTPHSCFKSIEFSVTENYSRRIVIHALSVEVDKYCISESEQLCLFDAGSVPFG